MASQTFFISRLLKKRYGLVMFECDLENDFERPKFLHVFLERVESYRLRAAGLGILARAACHTKTVFCAWNSVTPNISWPEQTL
jgi:hypothetical protein